MLGLTVLKMSLFKVKIRWPICPYFHSRYCIFNGKAVLGGAV